LFVVGCLPPTEILYFIDSGEKRIEIFRGQDPLAAPHRLEKGLKVVSLFGDLV
jgi:hypothetical protein